MPGLVVVNGARLQCTKCPGVQSGLIVAAELLRAQAGGQPAATILDHEVGTNVEPFAGDCQTTGEPCDPVTPIPWFPGESSALLPSLAPLLSESAILICTKGSGVIQIVDPGQAGLEVNQPSGEECTPPPEPGFLEELVGDLLMEDVANAPGPDDCIVHSESDAKQALDFALVILPVKVGVAGKLRGAPGKVGNRTRRAGGTTAVTLELAASRRAGLNAARARLNAANAGIRVAAERLARFIDKHNIEAASDGTLTAKTPKAYTALKVLQAALKEAIRAAGG